MIATPHIAGSTEEAQEIVGVRIAEQVTAYLQNGIAVNAVNMPPLTRGAVPRARSLHRAGRAAGLFCGANLRRAIPSSVRLVYSGQIGNGSTHLIRNSGMVGLLNRWLSHKATLVNAMQIATQRGLSVL